MELYQIRHFVAVVETGSFTKGAQREAVTQPAISASIAKLESEFEVKLLERGRSSVIPTRAGLRLLKAGKIMLYVGNSIKAELKSFTEPKRLRLGIFQALSSLRISKLLSSFRQANPHVNVEVFDGSSDQLKGFLLERRLDAVFTILDGDIPGLESRVLFEEQYALAIPMHHRLAQKQSVEVSDLHDESFIMRTEADRFQDGAKALVARGIKIRPVYQTDHFDRSMALVAAGLGLAVVAGGVETPGVKLVPISDLGLVRRYGLQWLNDRDDEDREQFIKFAELHGWTP